MKTVCHLPYHSALKRSREESSTSEAQGLDRYEFRGNIAFQWDASRGLPEEYKQCDFLYAEPPFRPGMKFFNEMSGIESSYKDVLSTIDSEIHRLGKPAIIINMKKAPMVHADHVGDLELNGDPVKAYYYQVEPVSLRTTVQVINTLAKQYKCVGDFCCGFGGTGLRFLRQGKRFVMSDYNGKCIRVIKELIEHENISQK